MAKLIVSPRQTGKTTEVIKWMELGKECNESRILITFSGRNASLLRYKYPNFRKWQFSTLESSKCCFKEAIKEFPNNPIVLAVDDIDLFICALFDFPIEMFTITANNYIRRYE